VCLSCRPTRQDGILQRERAIPHRPRCELLGCEGRDLEAGQPAPLVTVHEDGLEGADCNCRQRLGEEWWDVGCCSPLIRIDQETWNLGPWIQLGAGPSFSPTLPCLLLARLLKKRVAVTLEVRRSISSRSLHRRPFSLCQKRLPIVFSPHPGDLAIQQSLHPADAVVILPGLARDALLALLSLCGGEMAVTANRAGATATLPRDIRFLHEVVFALLVVPGLLSRGIATAACGVKFLYPTTGLQFYHLDTINVTYQSSFSQPTLSLLCGERKARPSES